MNAPLQLPLKKASYLHLYKGASFAHSGGTAYWFDLESLRVVSRTASLVKMEPLRPWETRCVLFEGESYGVFLGKLWRFRGTKVDEICDAPEVHPTQLFSDGTQLLYLSRYGSEIYKYWPESREFRLFKRAQIQPGSIPYAWKGRCFATTGQGKSVVQFDSDFRVVRKLNGLYDPRFVGHMVVVCANGALVDLERFERHQCAGTLPELEAHLRLSKDGEWELSDAFFSCFPAFKLGQFKWGLQHVPARSFALQQGQVLRSPSAGALSRTTFPERRKNLLQSGTILELKTALDSDDREYVEEGNQMEGCSGGVWNAGKSWNAGNAKETAAAAADKENQSGRIRSKTLRLEDLLSTSFSDDSPFASANVTAGAPALTPGRQPADAGESYTLEAHQAKAGGNEQEKAVKQQQGVRETQQNLATPPDLATIEGLLRRIVFLLEKQLFAQPSQK